MLQGLAILAMVWLHLFDRRDFAGLFQPLIFIREIPLSFYVAQLSDFCVFCFAFCSGYAHMSLFGEEHFYKRRLKGLLKLLIQYAFVVVLFSGIGLLTGQGNLIPGSFLEFLGNITLINVSYNGAWWYMWAYVLLVLLSPLILYTVKKTKPWIILIAGFVIYCGAFVLRFKVPTSNYFLQRLGPFGMTLYEYVLGCVCFKAGFISKTYKQWEKLPAWGRISISIVLLISLLAARTLLIPSLFFAPLSGAVIMMLFHFWKKPAVVKKSFLFFGKHSTNIWLTHMFFYLTLFKDHVYIARFPLAIYCYMLLITVAVSYILIFMEKPILKRIP